jgi:hypothetical protein
MTVVKVAYGMPGQKENAMESFEKKLNKDKLPNSRKSFNTVMVQ